MKQHHGLYLHCNKTPVCVQAPGDLLTRLSSENQQAGSDAASDDDIIGFGSSFQLVLSEVMSPKLKLTVRLMMIDFTECFFFLRDLNWCSVSSMLDGQESFVPLAQHIREADNRSPFPRPRGTGKDFRARGDGEIERKTHPSQ